MKTASVVRAGLLFAMMAAAPAAFAAGGWYLLVPPVGIHGRVLDGKPLSAWRQVFAFDSALSCENAMTSLIEVDGEVLTQTEKDPRSQIDLVKSRRARYEAAQEGRCISADDPRLANSNRR